jgi:tRNA modification GTPase
MSEPAAVDTVAAIATGVGGAIAVIRLSGPAATTVADGVWRAATALSAAPPRTLVLGRVEADGAVIDGQCLAVRMPAPHSYTGEDVVEFQCHGGPLVARSLLAALLAHGARHAEPGEFSKRAFINGRLGLTQAEAVLDVIQAHSAMALHTANRQLRGVLRRRVDHIHDALADLLAEVEVRMDFVDEDLDWRRPEALQRAVAEAVQGAAELLASRGDGDVLREGVRLAIVGAPNTGKSSLLNRILGHDRAIVTDIPGTTRDTLEELAHIRGIPVRLVDTAGIRDAADAVEQAGISRSLASLAEAQLVLWVVDAAAPATIEAVDHSGFTGKPLIVVANKSDLAPDAALAPPIAAPVVYISALTGDGIPALYDAIERAVWESPHHEEPEVAVNARHADLLATALQHLEEARGALATEAFEIAAVSLRSALDALGLITGRTVAPDILDTIFHRYCIGK